MTATEILRLAHAAGLDVSLAASGNLFVVPIDRLKPELRALLVEHKAELIEFIRAADKLTAETLARAMAVCDRHGDGERAREAMRQDVLNTPAHLRADLLDHLRSQTGDH